MTEWFIRAELDKAITDAQAEVLAKQIGSAFVDRSRARTEVNSYMSAADIHEATTKGLAQLSTAITTIGLDAKVIQLEVKTAEDRVAELAARGIPVRTELPG